MNPARQTADLQQNGGLNCAQALLTVFGKPYGIDADTARALGRPLGGGVAQQAGVCGYLIGALLILSLARHQPDESSSRQAMRLTKSCLTVLESFTAICSVEIFWGPTCAHKKAPGG